MGSNDINNFDGLYGALMKANPTNSQLGLPRVRIISKRGKHSERLAERIEKNAKAIDILIDIIKSLNKKQDTEEEVDKLIDLARDMLENNAKLKEQVGDVLQDIPPNG